MRYTQRFPQAVRTTIFLFTLCLLAIPQLVVAANPPPVQTFYIPFPEDQVLQSLQSIYPGPTSCNQPSPLPTDDIQTYISVSIISDGTLIYYDHWEDGYEVDVANPVQSTTQIWGDGETSNGFPPDIPSDLLTADTVIVLDNAVNSTTLGSVVDFDGRDRVSSTRQVAMTRASWASGSGTLLAGALEVYDTFRWGQRFQVPVGEDVDSANQLFEYTGISLMTATDGTIVDIDQDGDGVSDIDLTLNRGESHLVDGSVLAGATIDASAPIQVAMITGDRCDIYESRWYVLFPTEQWSDSYFNPVGTPSGDGTRVFVFNPTDDFLAVNWETTAGPQSALNIPAKGTASATIPDNSGAHFYTNGTNFVAIAAVGASNSAGFNTRADWGFALVPQAQLTSQILVGLGIGRDPTSATNPSENGSPVWVMPVIPDGASGPVDVCVDYDGDGVGPLTDPQGLNYDLFLSLNEMESRKVFDPDGDQTGMVLYRCDTDPALLDTRIVAAWGQAPGIASAAAPGLDLGTTAPPASSFTAGKGASLALDPDGDTLFSPGDTVSYSLLIGNASRVPISNFVVSDTVPANTAYVLSSTLFDNGTSVQAIPDDGSTPFPLDEGGIAISDMLPVQGTFTVTFQVAIDSPFPVNVSTIQNQATIIFNEEEATPSVETEIDRDPDIVIEKATNGVDADSMPGPFVRPGDPITWTYQITNTGVVSLTNINVHDSTSDVIPTFVSGDLGDDGVLDVGESWLYQATGIAISGQYTNVGSVAGTAFDGDVGSDSDPSHYFGVLSGITVTKDVDQPVILSGQTVTYMVVATNTGNVALSNLTLDDDQCSLQPVEEGGFNLGDTNQNGTFDPGEGWRYQCITSVVSDTLNTATATGTDPLGTPVTGTDTATVDVINPALAVAKIADQTTVLSGTLVTYAYSVTNPGDVPLSAVNVSDDRCSPVTFLDGDANSDSLLDPNEVWRYQCSANITDDTVNTATATATDPLGNGLTATDTATVDVIAPALAVAKSADQTTVLSGTLVTYAYTVTNPGDVPLSAVNVSDDRCSPVTFVDGDANGDTLLDLGEIWRYQCSATLTSDTTNTATATATDPLDNGLTVTDTATVDVINPALSIVKVADQMTVTVGTVVTYTYTVTNPGDVPLSAVNVSDDRCSPVTFVNGDANSDSLLDLDEAWTYQCSTSLTSDTTNTGTATATDPLGNGLTVTDTATVQVVMPALSVVKSADQTVVLAGTVVTYTYTVTNSGDVPLSAVSVGDDLCSPVTFVDGDANSDSLLDLDEVWRYQCSATITADTVNTATATGTDPLGNGLTATDTATVDVIAPALAVAKSADKTTVLSGTLVTYTYTVTNPGDVPLSAVNVSDDLCSPVTFVDGDANGDSLLDLGEVWRYQCSAILSGDTINTATATATDPLGNGLSVTDTATVDVINPALAVAKSADQTTVLAGTLVTYAYTVTNPGDVPLASVNVSDDRCSPVTFLDGDTNSDSLLDLDEVWRYQCSATLSDDTINTATATATDPLGNGLTVTATATVNVIRPMIHLDKVGSRFGVLPGDLVTYTYTVTNPGNVPLASVTVSDDLCSPVTFLDGDANGDSLLDLDEAWRYQCVATITERTLNTGTATGVGPLGTVVMDEDTFLVTINIIYLPIIIGPPQPPQECPPPDGCPVDGAQQIKGIAVDEGEDRLYITSQGNNKLLMVDAPQVQTLVEVDTGLEPWGVVVDEADRRVYVSNYGAGEVWVHDADTLAVLAKIPVGQRPGLMAILPNLDTVMVLVNENSQVVVIQGTEVIQTLSAVGSAPYGIAADPVQNQFFISNRESGHLVAYVQDGVQDGSRWVRVTGPLLDDGRTLFEVAYNPGNNKLYLVYVTEAGGWFVDVWKADVGNAWGLIYTIPVDSGGALSDPLVGGTGIEVNRSTGNLFNVNTGAANMTVVNGTDNGIRGTIALGPDPFAIAIDESRNLVYVGLRSGARLVKVADTYR